MSMTLFIHNAAGGEAGWGGPVRVRVESPAAAPAGFFDVRQFGAKGNGFDDDTAALRAALVQAGEAGGGTVFLPPGRYALSATLWIPPHVTLQGAGPHNSILAVRDERPMRWDVPDAIAREMPGHFRARQQDGQRGAMLWMRDRSRVVDLGFVDGLGTLLPIFVGTSSKARTCTTARAGSISRPKPGIRSCATTPSTSTASPWWTSRPEPSGPLQSNFSFLFMLCSCHLDHFESTPCARC